MPAHPNPPLLSEADIGSGHKSPGQLDTEKLIEQIGENKTQPGRQEEESGARNPGDGAAQPASGKPDPDFVPSPGKPQSGS